MDSDTQNIVVFALLILIGTGALMLPLLRYLCIGWEAKRKDILDGLSRSARLEYFKMFCRSNPPPEESKISTEFEKLYDKWYGRRFFWAPGLLLFLVGIVAVTTVVFTGLNRLGYMKNPLVDLPVTALAAIAGAYLWVVDDHIARARRLDFVPSDVHWGVLRIVIAIPMGYAFAAITSKSLGPFIAFAVGAFPLATLISMLRRIAEKNLGMGATPDEASDDIIKLQGVNKTIVERLLNEDITTVTQIAYCDPVRLAMRSNLAFNFVTDCMNQALAWMYFQDGLYAIRPLGMRGAVEIKSLIDSYDEAAGPDHDRAVAAMPLIASAIKQEEKTLQITFRQIAEDPYTIFLHEVWT